MSKPEGQRFSLIYLDRSKPSKDSERARRRLSTALGDLRLPKLAQACSRELGVDVYYGYDSVNWKDTLEVWHLRDVLDLVTLVFQHLPADGREVWVRFVRRVFEQENLPYTLDDKGGVHYSVDAEFAANADATIVGLGLSRYANAREQFQVAMDALSQAAPDGKQAIRSTFNAIEGVYRLMFPNVPRLDSKDAVRNLEPLIQRQAAGNAVALRATAKLLSGFREWIDSAHHYRHELGSEEPAQPPLELAVHLVSLGASHLRWLLTLDQGAKGEPQNSVG